MTTIVDQAVSALQNLPEKRREELAQVIIDAASVGVAYSDEQLAGIDAAIAEADAGNFASDESVEAAFAKFRQT